MKSKIAALPLALTLAAFVRIWRDLSRLPAGIPKRSKRRRGIKCHCRAASQENRKWEYRIC